MQDLHQARSTGVTDLKLALEKGYRSSLRAQHDSDCLLIELVFLAARCGVFHAEAGKLGAELRLGLFDRKSYHVPNFLVRDKCSLHTLQG